MNKQALTEALAAFDDLCDAFDAFLLSDADEEPLAMVQLLASMTATEPVHLHKLAAAARLVERLLPGECSRPHAFKKVKNGLIAEGWEWGPCPDCDNSGQVWDEEIEEAVGGALVECDYGAVMSEPMTLRLVHAVLSAIAELLTEKAGSQ